MNLLRREWQRMRQSILARNAGWMLIGNGSNLVLQAAYFAVLGRLLGSTEYGVYVGAFALTGLLSSYCSMGTGTLLLRYVSSGPGRFAAYWGNLLLTTGLLGGVIIVGAHFAAPHLINPRSASLVLFAGIANCFCSEIIRSGAMAFQAHEELRIMAILNFATSLARLAMAVGLLVTLHHISAFGWAIASMTVALLVAAVAIVIITTRYGVPTFSLRLMFTSMPEGFNYSFASSAGSVYNDVDKSMLSHYGLNQANGIYALAYRVIDAATTPLSAIRDAVLPRFFREGARDLPALKRLTFRVMLRSLVPSVGIAVLLYVTAPLLPLLAGKSFAESVSAVRWLCVLPLIRGIHGMTGSALLGMGKQTYRTMSQLGVAAFNFGVNLYLIPMFGWRGAAWSSVASDGLLAVSNTMLFLMLCRQLVKIESEPLQAA